MWFPNLTALDDLTVTETEDGFQFSAPPESECGNWLAYWDSSPELQNQFSSWLKQMLFDRLNELETKDGSKT